VTVAPSVILEKLVRETQVLAVLVVPIFVLVASEIAAADGNPVDALAGTTDNRPKPIADTATSAMRLRSVFVDICFLSISQDQEFPELGFG
jgi:hypothetical protein